MKGPKEESDLVLIWVVALWGRSHGQPGAGHSFTQIAFIQMFNTFAECFVRPIGLPIQFTQPFRAGMILTAHEKTSFDAAFTTSTEVSE